MGDIVSERTGRRLIGVGLVAVALVISLPFTLSAFMPTDRAFAISWAVLGGTVLALFAAAVVSTLYFGLRMAINPGTDLEDDDA